jgi:hypothetical protein
MAKKSATTIGPIHTPAAGAVKTFDYHHRTESRRRGALQPMHQNRALTDVRPGKGMGIVSSPAMESVESLYRGKKKTSRKGV